LQRVIVGLALVASISCAVPLKAAWDCINLEGAGSMAIKTSAVLEDAVHRIPIAKLTSGAPLFEWTIPPPSSDRRTRHEGIQFEPNNYQIALVSFQNGQDRAGGSPQRAGRMGRLFLLPLTWKEFATRVHGTLGHSNSLEENKIVRFGRVRIEYYPPLEGVEVASRIQSNTRLIWCESPGSITMEVQDVPAIVEAAHRRDVLVALDNTWAAGVLFDAFGHGADFSVQAVTKYIGGHSDLLLGSVTICNETLYQRLGPILSHLGMVVSPDDCSLALRDVRLKAIEESALRVASWFAGQPDAEAVLHPALPSCPGNITWRRDFTGSSGLFSVVFRPLLTRHDLHARMDRLKLFRMGYSWGGVSSLVVTPDLTEAPNARVYGERLVRFYIGLEDADDLISDVEQAFRR